jgi:thiamine-phosphate pyrophosphorylase
MPTSSLPRLYAIADAQVLAKHGIALAQFAAELRDAGVTLVQYRDKLTSPQQILSAASILRTAFAGTPCRLIMNDRADLAVLADFDGVHVGQGDLSPADARRVVGSQRIVGVSTHSEAQVQAADLTVADYIAIGPAFATGTKSDTEPVVGLEGIRRARALTRKPLVAIGGINRANARSVIEAGADSVAIISALLPEGESVEKVARDFLELLR